MSAGIKDIVGQRSFLRIEDIQGSYTIPHIQSSRDLDFEVRFSRMQKLRPSLWLIHLGVNDERAQKAPAEVAANLHTIIDLLASDYSAEPAGIFLATPSYDYAPGAESYLAAYRKEIIRIIDARGLRRGPDFFSAYSKNKELYYGEDPVHPNKAGMKLMAELWAGAVLSQFGTAS
jgi:lysophospholipase L1-like esterase